MGERENFLVCRFRSRFTDPTELDVWSSLDLGGLESIGLFANICEAHIREDICDIRVAQRSLLEVLVIPNFQPMEPWTRRPLHEHGRIDPVPGNQRTSADL